MADALLKRLQEVDKTWKTTDGTRMLAILYHYITPSFKLTYTNIMYGDAHLIMYVSKSKQCTITYARFRSHYSNNLYNRQMSFCR